MDRVKPDQGVESGGGNIGTAFTFALDKDLHGSLMRGKKGCGVGSQGRQERCHLGKGWARF